MRVAPGGPFDDNRKTTADITANLERAYHLDEPLLVQFGRYLWGVLRFDFGPSFKYRDYSVAELIGQGFPISLQLGIFALILSTALGLAFGAVAALRRGSAIDAAVSSLGMTGIVVPGFVMAPILQLVFGSMLMLLPVGGWDGRPRSMVLPVIVLALPQIAVVARLMRGGMIEALASDHVRTARAKGLGPPRTVLRHAMVTALVPVVAYLGPAAANIVTGSVVVEKIFGIPGIGRYFVEAALNRDYTLIMGVVIVYGTLIVLFNIVVDLLYAVIDPRVRHD
jgi:oligopeptide transport system permease protein